MRYLRIWAFVILALFIAGCAAMTPVAPTTPTGVERRPVVTTPQPTGEKTLPSKGVVRVKPKVIKEGHYWPTRTGPLFALITGPEAWKTFLEKHQAQHISWPEVDWDREILFVALMGGRPTGGFRIRVQDVQVQKKLVIIRVKEETPQPGEMVIQVLTSPFQVVALPREELPTPGFTLRVIMGKQVWEMEVPNITGDSTYTLEPVISLPKGNMELPTK
ncbi:MAG: protease complex subunit PrcB family protein [Chloroflexi bacterium]|nr:protease complex subunit PrcB family protein [Chloroflexota bacterium]